MALDEAKSISFFPPSGPLSSVKLGFRVGDKGTHSTRTLMFKELEAVLAAAPGPVDRATYVSAIVDSNCLAKSTNSTRRLTNQRLAELYGLDPFIRLFRIMRKLWTADVASQPLLALLAALARDPLLMASASSVLLQPVGSQIQRGLIRDAIRKHVGERMNDASVDKVVRNVSSSWTQSGHLEGRTFKFRRKVQPSPVAVAFALWLGNAAGFHGEELLTTGWIAALDCTPSSARALAVEAKRIGLIDLRTAADVIEFGLDRLDPGLGRP